MHKHAVAALGLVVAMGVVGCGTDRLEGRAVQEQAVEAAAAPAPAAVDSVVPIGEALARFREDLGEPRALAGGARSPEALTREVVRLLAAADTAGFAALTLDRAEFAWLYYESSPLSRAPYELPPALMWFQLQQGNRTGLFRALRELGGRGLEYEGLRCESSAAPQGENLLWSGCTVRLAVEGESREMRLFGALLERDGRVKVLSYTNDF